MKYTFLTLLSTENYLKGVLVLHKSLKNTKTKYPFTVLLSDRISKRSEKILQSYGIDTLRMFNSIDFEIKKDINTSGPTHWNYTFEKLSIFGLTQFDKIVFLDSDMLVLENIDELFQKDHMSAVGPAGGKYPGNESYNGLNSGLLVIKPNKMDFQNLIERMPKVIQRLENCGDQDVIIDYFIENWRKENDLHLDDKYNMIFPYIGYYVKHFNYTVNQKKSENNIKVVHFIGTGKPWMQQINIISYLRLLVYFLRNKILNREIDDFYQTKMQLKYQWYLLKLIF